MASVCRRLVRGFLTEDRRPAAGERLARLVAGASAGAGAVFEQRLGSRTVRISVRGVPISADLLDPPNGDDPPPFERFRAQRWDEDRAFCRVLTLVTAGPAPSPQTHSPPVPPIAPAPEAGSEVALQTFWLPGRGNTVAVARRALFTLTSRNASDRRSLPEGSVAAIVDDWALRSGRPCRAEPIPAREARRDWETLGVRSVPRGAWVELSVALAARTMEGPRTFRPAGTLATEPGHLAIFGATGSGKTSALAEIGIEAIVRGTTVIAFDLHGDLAPAIVARLSEEARRGIVAIDATERPVPGFDVLGSSEGRIDDRLAAHVVAALKRLTFGGEEIYWGFRLERIFDSFVRIVQEEGGTLVDLAELLARPERREAARWNTRRPELARFLEEIEPVAKRQPEILWAAGARLAKVVLVPSLKELLAPEIPGWSLDAVRSTGGSLLLRIPFAEVGPEAAGLAMSLLLARLYLDVARTPSPERPVLFLLDECQAISSRLLTDLLTEGRKFGIRVVAGTQYPGRLAPEAEAALSGSMAGHVCFRIPRSSAGETARWLGLDPSRGVEMLASLPTGSGWKIDGDLEPVHVARPPGVTTDAWKEQVRASRFEGDGPGPVEALGRESPGSDRPVEALLLAASVLDEDHPRGFTPLEVIEQARSTGPSSFDATGLAVGWHVLQRSRWVEAVGDGCWRLAARGASFLGVGRSSGASRETSEHRALLQIAQQLLARRGCRLEIVRQGRFDTTLPDGRVRLVAEERPSESPRERAADFSEAQRTWAWRFFGGRDVHVEAEVSGALRPERVERGIAKALRRGAFALFLVGDAGRARRVRAVLRAKGLVPSRGQVWTLSAATAARPPRASEPGNSSAPPTGGGDAAGDSGGAERDSALAGSDAPVVRGPASGTRPLSSACAAESPSAGTAGLLRATGSRSPG